MNNSSTRPVDLEPEAVASGNSTQRAPDTNTISITLTPTGAPTVEAPAPSRAPPASLSEKMHPAQKDLPGTKGPVVKIRTARYSEYVTATIVSGVPSSCADMYYHFLRRQLVCTGHHHDDGRIELLRVSCRAVKACLDRLRFSEKDLDFQVVN